jgi:hypothetical protein
MPDTIAKKGDPKYRDLVWAGLITDPDVLEEERRRRATPPSPAPKTLPRRVTKHKGGWIPIGRLER